MTPTAQCRRCGGPLATDQRYCLNCGERISRSPLPVARPVPARAAARPDARSWLRIPTPTWSGALAAAAIGFGLMIGVAIGPGPSGLANGLPSVIQIPGGSGGDEAAADSSRGGDIGGAPLALGGPIGNTASGPVLPAPPTTFAPTPLPATPSPLPTAPDDHAPRTPNPPPPAPPTPHQPQNPNSDTLKLSGVVVHVNPAAHSYSLARGSGPVTPVHANSLPKPGSKISVPARELFNGTFAEKGKRTVSGRSDGATISGTVTFRDAEQRVYSVSTRGASILVRMPEAAPPPQRAPFLAGRALTAADPQEPPPIGTSVTVTVAIAEPPETSTEDPATEPPPTEAPPPGSPAATEACAADPAAVPQPPEPQAILWQRKVELNGVPFAYGNLEGIVQAVCDDPHQLLISADDIREAGSDVVIDVPRKLDLADVEVGDSVDATATIEEDDSFALTGLSSDQGTRGADDESAALGDQAAG